MPHRDEHTPLVLRSPEHDFQREECWCQCLKSKRRIIGSVLFLLVVSLFFVFVVLKALGLSQSFSSPGTHHTEISLPAQLSNNARCQNLQFTDEYLYRHRRVLFMPQEDSSLSPAFLPIFSTHQLVLNKSITSAVVWFHGLGADANKYFCSGLSALRAQKVSNVVGIAPWFGNVSQQAPFWGDPTSLPRSLFWNVSDWIFGGPSSTYGQHFSSFSVIDHLVDEMLRKFPNLNQIALTGFSAGAQLLTRWAFFSSKLFNKNIRCVVGDPGTFLYFHDARPDPKKCSPLKDTGADHFCEDFGVIDSFACPNASWYHYGLDFAHLKDEWNYLLSFKMNQTKLNQSIHDFAKKDVRFLFGSKDICNCNWLEFANDASCFVPRTNCTPNKSRRQGCVDTFPDSWTQNALDATCAGMLQGSNRLQRGLNYMSYLTNEKLFGDSAAKPKHSIFRGSHDVQAFYGDLQFSEWAYLKS